MNLMQYITYNTEMQLQSVLKMFAKTIILLCAFSVHCSGQNIDYDSTTSSGFCECPFECICTTEEIDCSAKSLIKVPIQFEKCDWLEIEVLNISHNLITSLYANSFSGLFNLERLYINNNLIFEIHNESFVELESLITLELSSNRLSSIDSRLFHPLQSLKRIYLYSNNISRLPADALSGLSSLQFISLDNNIITYIDAKIFEPTRRLQSILLYNNRIRSLPEGVFNGLHELTILAIHNNEISSINQNLFISTYNLQRIYIQNNQIAEIPSGTFQALEKLLLLYFSGNILQKITSSSLVGLNSLHTLVLSNNRISKIDDAAFNHTRILQELYMDDNNVETVTVHTFSSLLNLRTLRISSNQIKSIADGAFINLRYLHTLFLSNNKIEHVSNFTFYGLSGIYEIVLSSNQISQLPGDLFRSSRILTRLWLQQNQIQCIDETAFKSQDKLNLLNLINNQISFLPNELFQYTPSLKYLLLSGNKLTRITTQPFRNLPYLIQLMLYHNNITYIKEGSFDGTDNILFLQWNNPAPLNFETDNSLECNCQAAWLQTYIITRQTYYATVYCSGPDYARGRLLSSVQELQQNCTNELRVDITPNVEVMHVIVGDCVRLRCEASKSANLSWTRLEANMRVSPHEDCGLKVDQCGITEDTKGLLTLAQFTAEDDGTYMCTATSAADGSIQTTQIRIVTGDPPTLVKVPEAMIVYRDPPPYAIFIFEVTGNPLPTIEWFYNEEKIIFNNRIHMNQTGTLLILDTQYSDNGHYKAVATNKAGRVEAVASLHIHFPSPCFGIGCQNGGSCIKYHQCECPTGFTGNTCDDEQPADNVNPTDPVNYGEYNGSGYGYYYYSGDYYDYDDDDVDHRRMTRATRRKMKSGFSVKNKLSKRDGVAVSEIGSNIEKN